MVSNTPSKEKVYKDKRDVEFENENKMLQNNNVSFASLLVIDTQKKDCTYIHILCCMFYVAIQMKKRSMVHTFCKNVCYLESQPF